jgi:hypothetical protein
MLLGIDFGKFMLLQKPSIYFGGFVAVVCLLDYGCKKNMSRARSLVHFATKVKRMIGMFF